MLETGFLIALVIGFTEALKQIGLPKRFIPLIAIVLGVGFNLMSSLMGYQLSEVLFYGAMAGLMAMGLWSGTSTVLGK